jgi:hypothetical protein
MEAVGESLERQAPKRRRRVGHVAAVVLDEPETEHPVLDERQDAVREVSGAWHPLRERGPGEHSGPEAHVRLSVQYGANEARQLLGGILAVRMQEGVDARVSVQRTTEAALLRGPVAAVHRVVHQVQRDSQVAGCAFGLPGRVVPATVIHHDEPQRRQLREGESAQGGGQGGGGVVRGNHHGQLSLYHARKV